MSETYILEKAVWTEQDFDQMSWHDVQIFAMSFLQQDDGLIHLAFDIDYIFKWVHPHKPGGYFSFWLAPCTLIFENVYNLELNIDTKNYSAEIEIDRIEMNGLNVFGERMFSNWQINLHNGSIDFESTGYKQIVRREPILNKGQYFDLSERGGISFDTKPCK
ncbi:MAG: hypothetical protein JST82_02735 [Bacteroidetes bacterium]|nr:hypothetical protein [Bacteroidota bacterium]